MVHQLKPDDATTLGRWDTILGKLNRYDESLAKFQQAYQLQPRDPDILYNWEITLKRVGRKKEAHKKFSKVKELEYLIQNTIMIGQGWTTHLRENRPKNHCYSEKQ
ncbi:MAG: tetratricopeptide repeat protein [Candidatus Heimdallarchaeota archaeon]